MAGFLLIRDNNPYRTGPLTFIMLRMFRRRKAICRLHPTAGRCKIRADSFPLGNARCFVKFKVENLCGFLIRSKLMTAAEMQAMRARWLIDAKDAAAQVPAFLKWLVAKNYLTEYQAGMLSRGHADDF